MARSAAFHVFHSKLALPRELLRLDTVHFKDPPRAHEQTGAGALRSAAVVLMVASFEEFVSDLAEELVEKLLLQYPGLQYQKLPERMRLTNTFTTLHRALRGPRFSPPPPKVRRIPAIMAASVAVAQSKLNPAAFSDAAGNPSSANVRSVLQAFEVTDVFKLCHQRFERKWGAQVAKRFLIDELDAIVSRRHQVAHRAQALGVSRKDLRESIRFLRILGEVIDIELAAHLRVVGRSAL